MGEEVVEVVEDGTKGAGGAQVDRPALVVLDGAVVPSDGAEVVVGGAVAEDVEGFAAVFDMYPDAHWGNDTHFVCGDRGVSQWTFLGTRNDGSPVEVDGCDIFTFKDGKIAVKDSYRKNRTAS